MRQIIVNAIKDGESKDEILLRLQHWGGLSRNEAIIRLLKAGVQFGKHIPKEVDDIPSERKKELQELSLSEE